MKTIWLMAIALYTASALYANTQELSWVDEQIAAIKPPRKGIKNSQIDQISNPFVSLKKAKKAKQYPRLLSTSPNKVRLQSRQIQKSTKHTVALKLGAIINTSALINGKWYKEGQSVYGYRLEKVSGDTAILKKHNKITILTTKVRHKTLKFNNN